MGQRGAPLGNRVHPKRAMHACSRRASGHVWHKATRMQKCTHTALFYMPVLSFSQAVVVG